MVEELQVMSNTCLCTHMSKRRVVIRSSTGRNLDNCLPALNWLAYEESLMDEVLERNRVGLLLIKLWYVLRLISQLSTIWVQYPICKLVLRQK